MFCPHCGKEQVIESKFCPDCGTNRTCGEGLSKLNFKFLLTLLSSVCLGVFAFLNWGVLQTNIFRLSSSGVNLFSVYNVMDIIRDFFVWRMSPETDGIYLLTVEAFSAVLITLLMLSFILLAFSLAKHHSNPKTSTKFAYLGYGLNAFVAVLWCVMFYVPFARFARDFRPDITVIPILSIAISLAMIFALLLFSKKVK